MVFLLKKKKKKGIWLINLVWKICEVQDITVVDMNKKQNSQAIYDTKSFN